MGQLLGIATRVATKVPMDLHDRCEIRVDSGVGNDFRGRPGDRQVTVLSREDWAQACAAVGADLDWTLRRANLLVEGVGLTDTAGCRLRIGEALLDITGETDPCHVMDKQHSGLRSALEPGWRGGVSCRVVEAGVVRVGDPVELLRR